ncbi:MAG: hypothetical protein R6T96_09700 [Longimicrobiales bacterium]
MTSPQTTSPGVFPWGRYRIPSDETMETRLGPLAILLKKEGDEIRLTHGWEEEGEGPGPPERTGGGNMKWERWAGSGELNEIEFLPAFPDRPLVLQPDNPFRLLPGARARVFVRVPLWVQIRVPGKQGGLLDEIPTRILSDTWWGGFGDGEMAYWLHITARRGAPREIYLPDRIICPLALENRAGEDLPVEKILLRVSHLSVFQGEGSLWSDEVRVRYRGEEEGSELEMTGKNPPEAPGARRLASPRIPMAMGFTARTFTRLKALPGLGASQ